VTKAPSVSMVKRFTKVPVHQTEVPEEYPDAQCVIPNANDCVVNWERNIGACRAAFDDSPIKFAAYDPN
jgi:hypothetical protein